MFLAWRSPLPVSQAKTNCWKQLRVATARAGHAEERPRPSLGSPHIGPKLHAQGVQHVDQFVELYRLLVLLHRAHEAVGDARQVSELLLGEPQGTSPVANVRTKGHGTESNGTMIPICRAKRVSPRDGHANRND